MRRWIEKHVDLPRRLQGTLNALLAARQERLEVKRRTTSGIRTVNIGLTGRCNLRCVMCSAGHSIRFTDVSRPDEELSELAFERFLEAIREVEVVSVSGRGEPLLARDAPGKLRRIREACPKGDILLTTNGTLLRTDRVVEEILAGINKLHLSVNGILSSYDQIMVGSRFEALVENLGRVVAARRRFDHFRELAVGYVVMRSNVHDIYRAARLFKDMGLDGIVYRELTVCDEGLREESIRHDPGLLATAKEEILKAQALAELERFWVGCEDVFPRLGGITGQDATVAPAKRGSLVLRCNRPWSEFLVDEEGNVLICCIRNTRIGNLNTERFIDIWSGQAARNYRRGLLEGRPYKHCRSCRMLFPDSAESYVNLIKETA